MSVSSIDISVVCPFYNEGPMVDLFMQSMDVTLKKCTEPLTFEIVCINDGSQDDTLAALIQAKQVYPTLNINIINLSRNFGKEAALTAGLDYAKGEAIIPIDADLQDPPELILEFITRWRLGFDVVLAKRIDRSSDSMLKRKTAELFYKVHNQISSTHIPENVGDFRLMSRRVVDAIQKMPENQRFMKGIFAWVGFKVTEVEYVRPERRAGHGSFHGWNLWNLALDGITSFSTVPLRVWLYMGSFIASISVLYGGFILVRTLLYGIDLPGYASLFTAILFLGGVQLMGIGILGEYMGRLYLESKNRPIYIVEGQY